MTSRLFWCSVDGRDKPGHDGPGAKAAGPKLNRYRYKSQMFGSIALAVGGPVLNCGRMGPLRRQAGVFARIRRRGLTWKDWSKDLGASAGRRGSPADARFRREGRQRARHRPRAGAPAKCAWRGGSTRDGGSMSPADEAANRTHPNATRRARRAGDRVPPPRAHDRDIRSQARAEECRRRPCRSRRRRAGRSIRYSRSFRGTARRNRTRV